MPNWGPLLKYTNARVNFKYNENTFKCVKMNNMAWQSFNKNWG